MLKKRTVSQSHCAAIKDPAATLSFSLVFCCLSCQTYFRLQSPQSLWLSITKPAKSPLWHRIYPGCPTALTHNSINKRTHSVAREWLNVDVVPFQSCQQRRSGCRSQLLRSGRSRCRANVDVALTYKNLPEETDAHRNNVTDSRVIITFVSEQLFWNHDNKKTLIVECSNTAYKATKLILKQQLLMLFVWSALF